jgi:signal transduction histidine kinase
LCNAQKIDYDQKIINSNNCNSKKCQIANSFLIAESYLDTDDIEASQKWLTITKNLINPKAIDTTACYIHNLQSELFYYTGLYQFGLHEAQKGLKKGLLLNDSISISESYFYRSINEMEINQLEKSEKSLLLSRKYYPKLLRKNFKSLIYTEHINNNLAQVKLKLGQIDAAIYYNKIAYEIAKRKGSRRALPNSEQTFGEIYLAKKDNDSANYYFEQSEKSALVSNYYDIVLLNYGFLIQTNADQPSIATKWYEKGKNLIQTKIINATFRRLFYQKALIYFKQVKNNNLAVALQDEIIKIDYETANKSNLNVQNISNQYVQNESKILSLQIEELEKKQNIIYLQLLAAILCMIALALGILFIRRKNKINQTLLNQKNEISQDLHDDIGSGISSILIHANLLLKNTNNIEKQKMLATKINDTGNEISQRLSTFIWSLNPEHNNLQHFVEFVKQYAVNLFDGNSIQLIFTEYNTEFKNYSINGHDRKNLFFCVKEILNNAQKHSNATTIYIAIDVSNKKQLSITIQDNGIGLSNAKLFGNGMTNIKKRIAILNGTYYYKSENGLQTTLLIPLGFN